MLPSNKTLIILAVLTVAVCTAAAFFPSLSNGFVNWDDSAYVTGNEVIRELSAGNLVKMFTSAFVGQYCPLTILSYALDYRIFALDPFGYHLTNYILNITVAVMVFWFILLLSGELAVAFMAALLFGIHPLHVESVAWVSERKDIVCALFYVLTLIMYLLYLAKEKRKYYYLCVLFAACSLLSKAMAVTVPIAVILLDYFRGRKVSSKVIVEKVPFFILVGVLGAVNFHFLTVKKLTSITAPVALRVYYYAKTIPFYLGKALLPVNLSALYPYASVSSRQLGEIKYYIAATVFLVAGAVFSRRYSKKVIFGSVFFLCTIAPVLQIIPSGSAFAADRYMYLPSIGVFYILAVGMSKLFYGRAAWERHLRIPVVVIFSAWSLWLAVLTWQKCYVWKDTRTLFMDVLDKYPADHPVPYHKVGVFYARKGDYAKAMKYFKRALIVDPAFGFAAVEYDKVRQLREQEGQGIAPADRSDPDIYDAEEVRILNALGNAQGKAGKLDEAISMFSEAVKLAPGDSASQANLGYAYHVKGDLGSAKYHLEKAMAIDPDNILAKETLGNLHLKRDEKALMLNRMGEEFGKAGKMEDALERFQKAVVIDPSYAEAYNNIGYVYYLTGDNEKAKEYFDKALEADPELEKARYNLEALSIQGRDAVKHSSQKP